MTTEETFTHFDGDGNAIMVDVTDKAVTLRQATARCTVRNLEAGDALDERMLHDVVTTARAAAILGARQTSRLIPLCHPLPLTSTTVDVVRDGDTLTIHATAETASQTGVEMEALTACAVAALSIVSQVRATQTQVVIDALELVDKRGGRSGHWTREEGNTNRPGASVST